MFGIPFDIGYSCLQLGQTIFPSSTWIYAKRRKTQTHISPIDLRVR